jgi:uncharacterized protein YggE
MLAAIALSSWLTCQTPAATADGVVTGSGRAVISRQPEILRVQMVISAEGKDIAEATTKLKDAKAAATKSFADLGASEKSLEFGSAQVGTGADPRQQYMQRMTSMRSRGGAKPPEKAKTVTVSATLKAELPIKTGSPEELLMSSYNLQEKIKAIGASKKETKQLTPEEQEALEEAQAMQAANGGGETNPGDPTFQFVCKITDAEQLKAMTEAFAKAKNNAALVAKASGGELGALAHVSSSTSSPAPAEDENQAYGRFMMRQMMGDTAPGVPPTQEATSNKPGPIELQVTVNASFGLK